MLQMLGDVTITRLQVLNARRLSRQGLMRKTNRLNKINRILLYLLEEKIN
jgi:hypothetical protein